MTKYRLNIPETIPKKFAHMANCLEWFDGKILTLVRNDESGVRYDCEDHTYNSNILTDWLSEIKDSEFNEWLNDDFIQDGNYTKLDMESCWQASEENRDLLYKDLVDECEIFLGLDYERLGTDTANDMSLAILKMLKEVKEALKGNGND